MFLHKFTKYTENYSPSPEKISEYHNVTVPQPEMINLSIHPVCNLKCKMCYNWKPSTSTPDKLSLEKWKTIISQLRNEFPKDSMLAFTGSEPMLNPDIYELIQHAISHDFEVWLQSNGTLMNRKNATKLHKKGLENISFSLDSIIPKEHNTIRGSHKSFQQVMKSIDFVYEAGIKMININTVLCSYNIKNIEKLISWVQKNPKISTITLQAVIQPFNTKTNLEWFKSEEFSHLWPEDYGVVVDSINKIIRKKEKYTKLVNKTSQLRTFKRYFRNPLLFSNHIGCNVKSKQLNIGVSGNTQICPIEESGNLKNKSVKELWHSSQHKRIYENMERCSRNCHLLINCAYEDE